MNNSIWKTQFRQNHVIQKGQYVFVKRWCPTVSTTSQNGLDLDPLTCQATMIIYILLWIRVPSLKLMGLTVLQLQVSQVIHVGDWQTHQPTNLCKAVNMPLIRWIIFTVFEVCSFPLWPAEFYFPLSLYIRLVFQIYVPTMCYKQSLLLQWPLYCSTMSMTLFNAHFVHWPLYFSTVSVTLYMARFAHWPLYFSTMSIYMSTLYKASFHVFVHWPLYFSTMTL